MPDGTTTLRFRSTSDAETRALGRSIAAYLRPGDVLSLEGPLGSGKTAFVSGIGDGLGIVEPVTSPTFVLMRRHESGFLPLVHVDAYRLGSMGEFEDIGALEEAADGALAIEWGDAISAALPEDRLDVRFEHRGDDERDITLTARGSWVDRELPELGS